MFQPDLQGRREQIRVVQRCRSDVDGRWVRYTFIEKLAAARAAKLPNDALGGPEDARVTGQNFNLAAVESQPRDCRGGTRSATRGAMTNTGEYGFPGNAKPDCRAETAAFSDLNGFPPCETDSLGLRIRNLTKAARPRTPDSSQGCIDLKILAWGIVRVI